MGLETALDWSRGPADTIHRLRKHGLFGTDPHGLPVYLFAMKPKSLDRMTGEKLVAKVEKEMNQPRLAESVREATEDAASPSKDGK